MNTTTTIPQETIRNGVNVTRLEATIKAVQQQPELAQFQFRTRNEWEIGSRNVAHVDSFHGTCQEMEHRQCFELPADEPPVLLGEDRAVNPAEYVLAGLSSCMTTALAYHAAARGLELQEVTSEYEGDIDLQGMLGTNPDVRTGFREIRIKFRVKGDADEATIQELVRKSPMFDTLANPVTLKLEVEKV